MPGILNLDLIQSGIGRPYTGYYPKIWQKAGAIAQSVAGSHGFTDGNKRTAFYLSLLLFDQSGYWLQPLNGEDLGTALSDLMVQIANHQIEIEGIIEWFRLRAIRRIRQSIPASRG